MLRRLCKICVNYMQELVIGGYTPGANNFDALISGYDEANRLIYVARCRNGFNHRCGRNCLND
jgi:hypothetical protein